MLINEITPLTPLWEAEKPETTKETGFENMFGGIFQSAIDNVKETDAEKTQLQYLMATGQLDNPAELTLASSKYEMSVNLLVQLRNRAVEAYNEIMRISL